MPADEQQALSVWTRSPRRHRDRPSLSREQIVTEAVRLLDAEGLDALSMRRLGTALGAGATSLYTHVANKDELLELVFDEVYGELEVPDADPAGWRVGTILCAHSLRSMILRHPWIVSLFGAVGLAYLGPNVMRHSERMLAMFEAGGFPLPEANRAMSTVAAYVIGMASGEAALSTTIARSGQSEEEWAARLIPAAREATRPYPRLRRLYDELENRRDAGCEEFDYGLERVLDGLEAGLAARTEVHGTQ